mgnify:CR=1 FL=1
MLFDSTIPPVADPVIPRTDAPSKKFHCPVWTDERIEIVRARYPVENTEELAKELGVTVNSLQMACIRNNIKKDEDYIKNSNTHGNIKIAVATGMSVSEYYCYYSY